MGRDEFFGGRIETLQWRHGSPGQAGWPGSADLCEGCRRDTDPAVRQRPAPTRAEEPAAVTASAVPPLDGGPDDHASEATHAVTVADGGRASLSAGQVRSERRASKDQFR